MKVDSITDIGVVRSHNEDDVRTGMTEDAAWAVVCDGMGGANAGEVASQNGVQVISDSIIKNYNIDSSDKTVKYILQSSVHDANTVIFNLSNEYEKLAGMGTTVVAGLVRDGMAYIVHAGDSRAYLIRENEIRRLTRDHSVVQELVDMGTITQDQARIHPQRNIITKCLGVHPTVEPEYSESSVEPGDLILFCSDGLTAYITDEEILSLAKRLDPSAMIRMLVEEAKARGGSDNITVAIIEN